MNPILALIIANLIWGAASPIFKFALVNIPPFVLASIRFLAAGLIFIPLCVRHWKKIDLKDLLKIFLVGFFGVTVNIAFFFMGLQKTESINAPIIASSGPVLIFFLSVLFLREKPKAKVFIGMIAALFGVIVIIMSPVFLEKKAFQLGEIEGNLFFVLATLGSVLQTIISKNVLKKVNPYQLVTISFLFGGLIFLPLAKNELMTWSFAQLNFQGMVGIVFGVIFSSAVAYFLYYYGVAKIKAQEVGLFTYLDPITAIIIAIPLLGEYPNLYFFLGSILVFGGILLAEGRIHWHPWHKLI
jgi:drug/metabolite transporter (DMT)-like permease